MYSAEVKAVPNHSVLVDSREYFVGITKLEACAHRNGAIPMRGSSSFDFRCDNEGT